MQLTTYTDYSLRVLIYIAASDGGTVTIGEIADFYGISRNHLMKVAHHLSLRGYIESRRGKSGGLSLARPANTITIAEVVRATEPHLQVVECLRANSDECAILKMCRLKQALGNATKAFLGELDKHTLADIAGPVKKLVNF